MEKSKQIKKNNWEDKIKYLSLKERRERYINYILVVLLIIFLIFSIIYINTKRYEPKDKIAYTNTSNEKNKNDSFINFIYDNSNHNNPPKKNKYEIESSSCNNAIGSWDNNLWQLNISKIVDKVNCTLIFRKKNTSIVAAVDTKKIEKKKNNVENKNNDITNTKTIVKSSVLNNYKDNNIINDIVFNDYDKCLDDEGCDYKISLKSNDTITLNPIIYPDNQNNKDINYELIYGENVINLNKDGIIKANDTLYEEALIKISSQNNPNINKTIKVLVEEKSISSDYYHIIKNNDFRYITNVELKTSIENFLSKINNNKYIHIYDVNNKEILDYTKNVATSMIIKLEYKDKIYDALNIVVLGDVDGNGKCISSDYRLVNKYILGQIELKDSKFFAADINEDKIIDYLDYELINKYITKKINTFIK